MSTHPWKTILISTIITGLFCIGAGVNFTETNDNSVIWVPSDSDFLVHKKYVESTYPSTTRFFYLILVADNVLTTATMEKVGYYTDFECYSILSFYSIFPLNIIYITVVCRSCHYPSPPPSLLVFVCYIMIKKWNRH